MKRSGLIVLFLASVICIQAQNIKVYFNQSVDNTVSSITDAHTSPALDDTICALINAANSTLDLAVWDNGSTKIVAALNNAYNKGVQVRYISSSNSTNTALSGLNSSISVLKRNASISTNVMHNKFIVADDSILLTGSMNFGNGSMHDDYNNIVIINDTALAHNYTIEFNEMWGGTGPTPNTGNSKFGPAKTDNTQHSFNVGGTAIYSYFSPTDNTTNKIIEAIDSAHYTLDIAMLTFTNNDLGDAVIAAKNRGVMVRCIMENESFIGSEFNNLQNNGITVLSHQSVPYDFHHKYCIIDAMHPGSDPVVVTGSHNWTSSAETDNDENTLVIHNEIIAHQYTEEFTKRFDELSGNAVNESAINSSLEIFPNPSHGNFQIRNTSGEKCVVNIFNSMGELVYSGIHANDPLNLTTGKGIYLVQLISNTTVLSEKMIVE